MWESGNHHDRVEGSQDSWCRYVTNTRTIPQNYKRHGKGPDSRIFTSTGVKQQFVVVMDTEDKHWDVRPILIAGGHSTRMGSSKHLLKHVDGRPMYEHTLEVLQKALPKAETIYISLRTEEQYAELNGERGYPPMTTLQPLYDHSSDSMGPAAGLLAAHECSSTATWLVVGCDYPLLTVDALKQLLEGYVPPVTCYGNAQGYPEPMLGVWSGEALRQLKENVTRGSFGPSRVVRSMGGRILTPLDEKWIFGVNTPETWEAAMAMAICSDSRLK